ncbi:LysE family translocator [Sinorhizobium meliloti]|jgi:threonine/homoserine/homoserine lactone efflux protein|uniref:Probabable amino acid exporter n=3 Tax=Rhizobium meliloti TaxID=382 RepID=F7X410_SINMM|nr:LysE family translocator [Sinorhizobium meliloti]PST25185.1 LysE family translocator [Mesorhizobium loti]TWA92496.1 threonine/homoserine/homoserine lactone efflux protein [Ensifer sp. SEMIA 134]TWB28611.1 threonine/homoserine/homoserine lactone efflux protein [Ensifer sp. SEMIA 135]AEG04920.1 Lysine exporter protein (LYSE/YGGA) [Sinorhizobium meliloti BL225C]AEG53891.1 Lysine exporter protein (LYSE/YGGA) [Sinorhizobium meliloti AK83]
MSFEHWFAFAAASAVLLAIPGPTILLVISYALGHGRKIAGATVAGVALGDFTAMTASMLGLGALLATSAAVFTVLKWIGAAYLVWLGIKLWRAPVGNDSGSTVETSPAERPLRIFLHTYAVTALNPKSILFFVAFLPQFLDLSRPLFAQMAIFETTFLILATINAALYAWLAAAAGSTIRKPNIRRIVNRLGGSLLIGAGFLTAGLKRATS